MNRSSVYFPNINSIRFIAALLVIIGHINLLRSMYGLPSYIENPFVVISGRLGVRLFFVLSGFLITYLLFKEENETGTISIKDFYIRRVLRIWPLYYLIMVLALFVLPHIGFFSLPAYENANLFSHFAVKIGLYVLILPNMVTAIFGDMPYISQAWSIGAEEQFYLVWPVFMKKIKNKARFMLLVVLVFGVVKFGLNHYVTTHPAVQGTWIDVINKFWALSSMDCLAIGGLFSYIGLFNTKLTTAIKQVIFNRWVQFVVLALTVFLFAKGVYIPHIQDECFSMLFGIIIVNLAMNKKNILHLEFPILNYLGKISYGIYMYHWILIVFSFKILRHAHLLQNRYLYPMSVVLTVLVAGLSYRFFEKPFIARKKKYSKILSGDNVHDAPEAIG